MELSIYNNFVNECSKKFVTYECFSNSRLIVTISKASYRKMYSYKFSKRKKNSAEENYVKDSLSINKGNFLNYHS